MSNASTALARIQNLLKNTSSGNQSIGDALADYALLTSTRHNRNNLSNVLMDSDPDTLAEKLSTIKKQPLDQFLTSQSEWMEKYPDFVADGSPITWERDHDTAVEIIREDAEKNSYTFFATETTLVTMPVAE